MNLRAEIPFWKVALTIVGAVAVIAPVVVAVGNRGALGAREASTANPSEALKLPKFIAVAGRTAMNWQITAPNHIRGDVGPSWFKLSQAQQRGIIAGLWRQWANISTPDHTQESTLTLFYNSNEVGHARHTTAGDWEVVAY